MTVIPKRLFLTSREIPVTRFRLMTDGILSLLYPDSCCICSLPIARHQDCGVCDACWRKVLNLQVRPPWCASCGLPLQAFKIEGERLCLPCSLQMPPFSGARSYGFYSAELAQLIQGLKFRGRSNLACLLAPLLADVFSESWDRSEFDCVVPVPLHPWRKRERGFNQAALLARPFARLIGIPCCESILVRARMTRPQVGLSDQERWNNLKLAFKCRNPARIVQKRVLLLDDVLTTGATVSSAADALLEAGAMRVAVLTLARAVPDL
jgi:ComF family protein